MRTRLLPMNRVKFTKCQVVQNSYTKNNWVVTLICIFLVIEERRQFSNILLSSLTPPLSFRDPLMLAYRSKFCQEVFQKSRFLLKNAGNVATTSEKVAAKLERPNVSLENILSQIDTRGSWVSKIKCQLTLCASIHL